MIVVTQLVEPVGSNYPTDGRTAKFGLFESRTSSRLLDRWFA